MKIGMWERVRGKAPTDLWLISYSDLLTLLLAFFVLLLSVAQIGKRDFERLRAAINHEPLSEDQLNRLQVAVGEWIKKEKMENQIVAVRDAAGLKVQLANTVLFDSGKAALNPSGGELIDRFIALFRTIDSTYRLAVEGYSDDVPINNPQFRSNWSLSAARSVEVLERFVGAGVDRRRLSAEAFADTRPVLPSEGEAKALSALSPQAQLEHVRSLNRRVVLRVY